MDCKLHWKVDHINIRMSSKAQKVALVEELKEISNRDRNLPSSRIHLMLLLGFPDLHIDAVDGLEFETLDCNTDVYSSNTSCSHVHHTLNISNRTRKVKANLAP